MASLEQRSDRYRIVFRFGGKKYQHSLGTKDLAEATALLNRLEANLHDLVNGRIVLPAGADPALFLLSDGKVTTAPRIQDLEKPLSLGELTRAYLAAQETALEPNSLSTIGIHLRHLEATLGKDFPLPSLTLDDIQRHINRRRSKRGRRGKPIAGYTIRKEVTTFGAAWKWAIQAGKLEAGFPGQGLKYPKADEQPPFQTRAEIERQIERGKLEEKDQRPLWDNLFLTLPETGELLEFVRTHTRHDFLYPMVCFAAHTGARRSELLRSRIADLDLEGETAVIREKKRVRGRHTTRRVPLSPFLKSVMSSWFERHPGGTFTFCQAAKVHRSRTLRTGPLPVTRDEANDHFRRTLAGSKWGVVRGWHVLRHSFISNCAARGVDQRLIDAWVGHTTEEMRRRYTHLLPDQSARSIRSVFEGE